MSRASYEVGQVVYIISRKESRVYPVLIVEETVRKTLEGTLTSYMVRVPDKKGTVVPLEGIADHAYTSDAELREVLIGNATRSINTMVDTAVEIGRVLAPAGDGAARASHEVDGDEVVTVEMPDGSYARVKMPTEPVQG